MLLVLELPSNKPSAARQTTFDFDLLSTSCLYSLKNYKQRETQQSAKSAEAKPQKMFTLYLTWLWLLNLLLLQVFAARDCSIGGVHFYYELNCRAASQASAIGISGQFDPQLKTCRQGSEFGYIASISKDPPDMCVDIRVFNNEHCNGTQVGGMSVSQVGCETQDLGVQDGHWYQIFAALSPP